MGASSSVAHPECGYRNVYCCGLVGKPAETTEEEFRKMAEAKAAATSKAMADGVLIYNDDDVKVLAELEMERCGVEKFPSHFDWAEAGLVQPVREQICRSCYAISLVTVIEAVLAIEKQKVDPTTPFPAESDRLNFYDVVDNCPTAIRCNGGSPFFAAEYVRQKGGLPLESFEKKSGTIADGFRAVNIRRIAVITCKNEESLKYALFALGPLIVTIDSSDRKFQRSRGGIISSEHTLSPKLGSEEQHSMTLVGFGQDGDQKFWRIQNSSGKGWKEKGFVRIKRGINYGGLNDAVIGILIDL